jgi:hypothetical protein
MGDIIEIQYLLTRMRVLADRLTAPTDEAPVHPRGRGDVGAVTTETVIIIAGLAALALAVVAIIAYKVTEKAESIPTN